jgi:hypothetical protein
LTVKVLPLFTGLAFLVSVNLLPVANLTAQSADDKTSLTVTFANGEKVKLRSKDGPFPTIGISPGETVRLRYDLPAPFANKPLVVQALDGESVAPEDFFDGKRKVTTEFRGGSEPGLYRVLLSGGNNWVLVRFRVPDPENPASDSEVITPKSQEAAR